MKKSCILLMTLILCLCAGCSSQPAPDASQTRPETNLFETQVNSVNRAFVAETDLFRYVAALNQGLAEIDKESGEIVWYPERDSMCQCSDVMTKVELKRHNKCNEASGGCHGID